MRIRYLSWPLIAVLGALVAGGLAQIGSAHAKPADAIPASFTTVDFGFQSSQGGTTVTIPAGGAVSFSYPTGTSMHNVDFGTRLDPTSCASGGVTNTTARVPATPAAHGWTASCTFDTPGTYTFHCDMHSFMTGKVIVTGSSSTTTTGTSTVAVTNPRITASISSDNPKSSFGWYRSPVTVRFVCVTGSAALTSPCPAVVDLNRSGKAQIVRKAIAATDGGSAKVTAGPINIDRSTPKITISGIRNHATYEGSAPKIECRATDPISGLAKACHVKTTKREAVVHGQQLVTVVYAASATNKAGTIAVKTGSYRIKRK